MQIGSRGRNKKASNNSSCRLCLFFLCGGQNVAFISKEWCLLCPCNILFQWENYIFILPRGRTTWVVEENQHMWQCDLTPCSSSGGTYFDFYKKKKEFRAPSRLLSYCWDHFGLYINLEGIILWSIDFLETNISFYLR